MTEWASVAWANGKYIAFIHKPFLYGYKFRNYRIKEDGGDWRIPDPHEIIKKFE